MIDSTFLERRGFNGDPFSSTNSETEELLSEYFVSPPYFETVVGSPDNPKTSIVFAPRGSGKTAQRRMIEIRSESPSSRFFCITYSKFDGISPRTATLDDHLLAVCRLMAIGCLTQLDSQGEASKQLSDHQKAVLKYACSHLLSGLTESEFKAGLDTIKTLGDKAAAFWRKYGGVGSVIVNAVLARANLSDGSQHRFNPISEKSKVEGSRYLLMELTRVIQAFGYKAVYILVDSVDETSETSANFQQAFRLIEPLILDLPTLEQPGLAFKFFVLDHLDPEFVRAGGRPDRLGVSRLRWQYTELEQMLSRRLAAFSRGSVSSFNDLVDPGVGIDVHKLLAYMNPDSPRDVIRMASQIVAEHTRRGDSQFNIGRRSILFGMHAFSATRMDELYGLHMEDLKKIKRSTYSVNHLASNVFKKSVASIRNKNEGWLNAGAVQKIAEQSSGVGRPTNIYAFRDPRLVLVSSLPAKAFDSINSNIGICPLCEDVRIADDPELDCACGSSEQSVGLIDACRERAES